MHNADDVDEDPFAGVLRVGRRPRHRREWLECSDGKRPDLAMWGYPDTWLDGDHEIAVGTRTLDAVHTPGHTPGHFVFADRAPACCSRATTCCRRSRRRSGSSPCRSPSRSATSWRR